MRTVQAATGLVLFWLILTASLHPVDLALGLLISVTLGHWASRFLWSAEAPLLSPRQVGALVLYLLTLVRAIVASAVQVARIVLDPRLSFDPVTITHRTRLAREVSRVALANSLTLTPGTLSVELEGDLLHVHCLEERFAEPLRSGELERQVARVFEEEGG
jgi:multicomponent Na+:H+ antiporter subunit E